MGRMLARAVSIANDQGAGIEGADQPRRLGCTILTVQCDYITRRVQNKVLGK